MSPLVNVKGIRNLLVHAKFNGRFIKYFSKAANPFFNMLVKENDFKFDEICLNSFTLIKKKLVTAHVILASN